MSHDAKRVVKCYRQKKENAQNQLTKKHLRLTEAGFVVSVWSCGTSMELYRCLEKLYSINSAVKLSTASNKAFSCPFSGRSHTNNHAMFSTVCPASQRMPSKRSSRSTQWYNSHCEEKQVVIRDLNMHNKHHDARGAGIYLANVPGLDLLQFQQKLFIAASFQLLYESPAVGRLEECKNMSAMRKRKYTQPQILQMHRNPAYWPLQWGFSSICFCQPSWSLISTLDSYREHIKRWERSSVKWTVKNTHIHVTTWHLSLASWLILNLGKQNPSLSCFMFHTSHTIPEFHPGLFL